MFRTTHFVAASAVIGLLLVAILPFPARAFGLPTAFGGMVTVIRPCFGGGLVVATIRQPSSMSLVEVAALPSPFLYFMMKHPAEFVLGLLEAPTFCATSPYSGFWVPASFFYGTSI
ncbi:MAG TPA: hypothetical protein VNF51_00825 [Candidatus Paceibacterota bacterium]|nr:hypothetical protein [Candidatus Paceibacterota bacterium]